MQNTAKQNHCSSVASYDTQPGNEVGLFYNAPEPTRGSVSNNKTLCTQVQQHIFRHNVQLKDSNTFS